MKIRTRVQICAALMLWAGFVWAQAAAKPDAAKPVSSVQADANMVIVPVTVREKKGTLIKGLTKDSFSLQVKGVEQPIRYFENDNNQPLTFGLLVDVSHDMQGALDEEKKASQAFLDAMLSQSGDKAFVLHFAHDIELLQDVTADRARLGLAVRQLGSESATFKTTTNEGMKDSEGREVHGHGTSLYDAVYLAGDEILQAQKGRKALVLISNGVDSGSKEALTDAIEAAQQANVALYAIYIKPTVPAQRWHNGPQTPTRGGYPGGYPGSPGSRVPNTNPTDPNNQYCQTSPNDPNCPSRPNTGQTHKSYVDGKQLLERMCGETGGRVFEVSKKLSVEEIYAQIADELRTQYLIGFTPDATVAKGGYHQLDLRMTGSYGEQQKDRKIDVQARDGYYMVDR